MIQRIQTVYYSLAILALAIPLVGLDIFSFSNSETTQRITFFGNKLLEGSSEFKGYRLPDLPFYLLNLVGILLLAFTIFSFKNLKRQARIGRVTVFFLLIAAGLLILACYFYAQFLSMIQPITSIGIGFYVFAASILFVLLGNWGVKRDRKLLDSLNRLR